MTKNLTYCLKLESLKHITALAKDCEISIAALAIDSEIRWKSMEKLYLELNLQFSQQRCWHQKHSCFFLIHTNKLSGYLFKLRSFSSEQILKKNNLCYFWLTPHKAEQPLKGMILKEKPKQKVKHISKMIRKKQKMKGAA